MGFKLRKTAETEKNCGKTTEKTGTDDRGAMFSIGSEIL